MELSAQSAFYAGLQRMGEVRGEPAARAARAHELAAELLAPGQAERACGQGCSFCCHFPVGVSAPEVAVLQGWLPGQPAAAALAARVAKGAALRAGRSFAELGAALLPCAFLEPDGSCAVYPVRPLACRGWNSSSREACEQTFAERAAVGPPFLDGQAYAAVLGIAAGLAQGGATEELHTALQESAPAR
jgi:Fe-S-cluster containining protein